VVPAKICGVLFDFSFFVRFASYEVVSLLGLTQAGIWVEGISDSSTCPSFPVKTPFLGFLLFWVLWTFWVIDAAVPVWFGFF
jgi:hypothetical protein